MAYSRHEEYRNAKGEMKILARGVILKHQERLPAHLCHKGRGMGVTHSWNILSFLRTAHYSMLGFKQCFSWWTLDLNRGSEWHPQWASLVRTPQWKIKLYKTQTNIKWGSCCGLSLCTAAHAFTYMVHVGRNPAWSLTPPDPCRVCKPFGQQQANLWCYTATLALLISLVASSWTNSSGVWCLFELSEVLIIFTHHPVEFQLLMTDCPYCWPTALCCQSLTNLLKVIVTVWSWNSQLKHEIMS